MPLTPTPSSGARIAATMRKAFRHPGRAIARARFGVEAAFGHEHYVKFVVLGHARTGSNMLISMLNSHPNIYALGEVFAHVRSNEVDGAVAKMFERRMPRRIGAVGCKVFYYHPLRDDPGPLWERLRQVPELRVLHLRRRNVVRTIVSRELARSRGEWLATRSTPDRTTVAGVVTLSPEMLRSEVARIQDLETAATARLADLPRLDVEYEDLVASPAESFRRITDFLGVVYATPRATTLQQNPQPLRSLLANFDEVRASLEGSDLAHHLDE